MKWGLAVLLIVFSLSDAFGAATPGQSLCIGLCQDVSPCGSSTGVPVGLFVDLWRAWARHNNIQLKVHSFDTESECREALRLGRIDVAGALETQHIDPEECEFSKPIATVGRFAISPEPLGLQNLRGLVGRRVALDGNLKSDWDFLRPMFDQHRIRLSKPDDTEGTIRLVSEFHNSDHHALGFAAQRHESLIYRRLVFFCVRKGESELLNRVERGWSALSESEMWSIETTWLPASTNRILDQRSRIKISNAELEFLKKHPFVTLGASKWEPLTVNRNGNYSGIALEILEHHLSMMGVTPIIMGDSDWHEVTAWLDEGKVDGLGYAVPNEERRRNYVVSRPYVFAPLVAIAAGKAMRKQSWDSEPHPFVGRRIGILDDYDFGELVNLQYPEAQIVHFADRNSAARALDRGDIDLWLEIAPTARGVVAELGIDRFHVAFRTDLLDGMSLVTDQSIEPLVQMFNRSLTQVSNRDLWKIYNGWEPEFRSPGSSAPLIWLIALLVGVSAALSVFAFRLFSAVRLSRRRIEQSEQSLRRAQLVSKSGSLELSEELQLVYLSGESYRLFGETVALTVESLERHCARFDDASGQMLISTIRALRHGAGAAPSELDLTLKTGNVLRYQFCRPADGRSQKIITIQDVTEQCHRESEHKKLEDTIGQLQKLDALGNLAGGIAHDFNNILTASIVYNELAIETVESVESVPECQEAGELMQEVLTSSLRAKALIEQILTFGRDRGVVQEAVDMRKVVGDTLALAKASIPANVKLTYHEPSEPIEVVADAVKLMQVAMNLVTNAIQAMDRKIGVVEVRLQSKQSQCVLTVADQGYGIPQEVRERIFEPFFSTRQNGKNTGMGLSITHGIVRSFGGEISFESEMGKGPASLSRCPCRWPSQRWLKRPAANWNSQPAMASSMRWLSTTSQQFWTLLTVS